jgi:hypothetical protein
LVVHSSIVFKTAKISWFHLAQVATAFPGREGGVSL